SGVFTLDTSQDGHFAEARTRLELTYLFLSRLITNENFKRAGHSEVKSVSTPFSLPHDLFASVAFKETNVTTNTFTVSIVSPLNNYFEVASILRLPVLFFEEFGSEGEI